MPELTIPDFPEPLLRKLEARAERHERSFRDELVVCIMRGIEARPDDRPRWTAEEAIAEARELNRRLDVTSSAEFIEKAIREGRS
jgi:plasmid stability protein